MNSKVPTSETPCLVKSLTIQQDVCSRSSIHTRVHVVTFTINGFCGFFETQTTKLVSRGFHQSAWSGFMLSSAGSFSQSLYLRHVCFFYLLAWLTTIKVPCGLYVVKIKDLLRQDASDPNVCEWFRLLNYGRQFEELRKSVPRVIDLLLSQKWEIKIIQGLRCRILPHH